MRKHRETKKRKSGFRKNKRKYKEAKKTLCKKENVEKVFWSGNSEELKKRKCQNEPTQIFKRKKVFSDEKTGRRRKHKGIFRPFKKIKKWHQKNSVIIFRDEIQSSFFFTLPSSVFNLLFFFPLCVVLFSLFVPCFSDFSRFLMLLFLIFFNNLLYGSLKKNGRFVFGKLQKYL